MTKALNPSDILQAIRDGYPIPAIVDIDTETSGLHVDDGARLSTVSIAWEDPEGAWRELVEPLMHPSGVQNWQVTEYGKGSLGESIQTPIVSFAWPFDQGLTYTGKPEDTGQGALIPDAENLPITEWVAFLDILYEMINRGVKFGFHHAKFDVWILRAGLRHEPMSGIELEPWIGWDTQNVAHALWSYTGTTSLKPTNTRIWGDASDDEQQKVKDYLKRAKLPTGRWDLMPWDIIGQYADKDARLTTRLRLYQQEIIRRGAEGAWLNGKQGRLTLEQVVQRRLEVSRMLYRMERRGLPFDAEAVGPASRELDRRVRKLTQELPFQPATLPAAKHYWFGTGTNRNGVTGLGLEPVSVTENGSPQLNAHVVQKLAVRDVPGIETWRNLQKAKTANDRWYRGWGSMVGKDGRLRGSVRQNGTVSGRFSIERVQLQAIPHDFRLGGYPALDGLPTPRGLIGQGVPDGYRLWELDLANAELRVAAMLSKCARMLELIGEGADLHGDAAQQLFDVYPDDPTWGQMRGVAKRANFSLIFGVGWEKLQADIDAQTGVILSDGEAQKLVEDWNGLYPEYRRAIERTARVVQSRQNQYGKGWVQTANGERRWFGRSEETHKAFNQRVQSNLAQYGMDWWLAGDALIDQELIQAGYGNRLDRIGLVMLIHDSMVLLLPTEDGLDEKIVKQVQDVGVDLWSKTFPGVPGGVDAKIWGGGD